MVFRTATLVSPTEKVVAAVNDPLEHDANRAADAALSRSPGRARFKAVGPPRGLGGGGAPLAPGLRADFEPRFGHDFSRVRVYTDSEATEAAAGLRARAFTYGSDIGFAAHQYPPASREGWHLIAHELAHVVQGESGRTTKLHRQPTSTEEPVEDVQDIPDIHDPRISDSSSQEDLRQVYSDYGYDTTGVTFHKIGKSHWVADQVLRRRRISVFEEGSSGSSFRPTGGDSVGAGLSGSSGPTGTDDKGDPGGKDARPGRRGRGTSVSGEGKTGGQTEGKLGGAPGIDRQQGTIGGGGGDMSFLDKAAALASLIEDPNSLYEAKQTRRTGKGAQFGSGFIRGWLAQVLAVALVFGGSIVRLLRFVGGSLGKAFRGLVRSLERRALEKEATAAAPGSLGAMRRLEYESNPKHPKWTKDGQTGVRASKAPKNGQEALDNSLQISDNSSRRVGIDYQTGEIVIFQSHTPGKYHAHVRTWDQLDTSMQKTLVDAGMTDRRGKILRD